MELQIYELADIAAILEVEKSRIKNWTIGRPFSVCPSIRTSLGKGSRNLFSRNDVYTFALVKRLVEVGAPVNAIQQMLTEMETRISDDEFWRDQRDWMVITRRGVGDDFKIDVCDDSFGYTNISFQPDDSVVCSYGVRLKSLAESISFKINRLYREQDRTSPNKKQRNTILNRKRPQ